MGRRGRTRGSTWSGRKSRAAVLVRDRYRCRVQLPDICTTIATVVHHTLGWTVTGDDPRHMVAACEPCNQKIGDPRHHDPAPSPRSRRRQW